MNKPYLSIIVPVFNVEQYLHKCIDSIINQEYVNFELILINDGSTDNSGKICDSYSTKDKRVRVIHQINGGLSNARNTGIRNSNGKYIWFIDSDDWISKNAFLIVAEELTEDNKIEMLGFYESRVYEEINKKEEYKNLKKIPPTDGCSYLNLNKRFVPAACFYIYQVDFLKKNQFSFKERMLHEDDYFNLICFSKVKRIKKIDKVLYFYRIRENSILTGEVTKQRLVSYLELIKLSKSLLKSNLDNYFLEGLIRSYISILFVYLNKFQNDKRLLTDIIVEVKKIIPRQKFYFKDKKGVLIEKIVYNLSPYWYLKYKSLN